MSLSACVWCARPTYLSQAPERQTRSNRQASNFGGRALTTLFTATPIWYTVPPSFPLCLLKLLLSASPGFAERQREPGFSTVLHIQGNFLFLNLQRNIFTESIRGKNSMFIFGRWSQSELLWYFRPVGILNC